MAEQAENSIILIDGIEYNIVDLSDIARRSIDHIISLESNINRLNFELEQLTVSKEVFDKILRENLPKEQQGA